MKKVFNLDICFVVVVLLVCLSTACSDENVDSPGDPDVSTHADIEQDTKEPTPVTLPARQVRRLSIDQLKRSIPIVTDGLEWIEDFGEGPIDMLNVLAATLGAPDYLLITQENLEPSLIIAKFMQDASHRICPRWIARDKTLPVTERSLVIHEDWNSLDETLVKANIRALLFRFFARAVASDDDEAIVDLYELFDAAASNAPIVNKAEDGWLALCLALMTEPDFVLY
ncbi:MAG TPA: hypothetical protein EYN06_04655 [Myxococcales bacterium]|nr:hypothetical protein [Myxococcales bacterium]HIN85752.1 hypothetical protein [Myxococcales bacterium]